LAGGGSRVQLAEDLPDKHGVLRDREGVVAERLAIPAGDTGEAVGDVGNLDVKRRGIKQVKAAAREHPLPGARRFWRKSCHQLPSAEVSTGSREKSAQ